MLDTLIDDEFPGMILERYLDLLPDHSHIALTHLLPSGDHPADTDGDTVLPAWEVRHPRPERTIRAWLDRAGSSSQVELPDAAGEPGPAVLRCHVRIA
ncbi:hypothetical protein ACRAKI_22140 [Saccharothrix isguenensis]